MILGAGVSSRTVGSLGTSEEQTLVLLLDQVVVMMETLGQLSGQRNRRYCFLGSCEGILRKEELTSHRGGSLPSCAPHSLLHLYSELLLHSAQLENT